MNKAFSGFDYINMIYWCAKEFDIEYTEEMKKNIMNLYWFITEQATKEILGGEN